MSITYEQIRNTTYEQIRNMPTTLFPGDFDGAPRVHESCLRSYHILERVKRLAGLGTPLEVILELIALMEGGIHPPSHQCAAVRLVGQATEHCWMLSGHGGKRHTNHEGEQWEGCY